MKEIALTLGMVALVDDEDFERLAQHRWHATRTRNMGFYARRNLPKNGNHRPQIRLHQEVLGVDGSVLVDHIDGNGLNCQKTNLRIASSTQNSMNRRVRRDSTSRFKGVHYCADRRSWRAVIKVQGRYLYKRFNSEIDAAKWYDAQAREYFGDFAHLNFPEGK